MIRLALAVCALLVTTFAWTRAARAADPTATVRRFALVASSNDGGKDRVRLRYANSDAVSIADVLRQLGGLRSGDLLLVQDATRDAIRTQFTRLRTLVAASGQAARSEVLFYYSGHSDEDGLLVGGERVTYKELREWISGANADVRIAILDSCASGALIRQRGGTKVASFLTDRSVDARGHAFLTASSADEAAQESDRIGAAFFTHYLVSGLRGAADASGDGVVTLAEAYQFAYAETLRRTENTSSGPQHAAYDIQLSGIGDLVLTDLRATTASVVLEPNIAGRLHVRDNQGRLVVELQKAPAIPTTLALAPGTYTLTLVSGTSTLVATTVVRSNQVARVASSQFTPAPVQVATARGGDVDERDFRAPSVGLGIPRLRDFGGYAGMRMSYARIGARDAFLAGPEFAVRFRRLSLGFTGMGGVTNAREGQDGITLGFGGIVGRYDFIARERSWYPTVGVILGAGGIGRDDEMPAPDAEETDGPAFFVIAPELGVELQLTRWLRMGASMRYQHVAGMRELADEDLRGIAFGVHVDAGWF